MKRNGEDQDLYEEFINLEKRENFFEVKINNVLVWERIRHSVYKSIRQSLNNEGQSNTPHRIDSVFNRYLNALQTLITSGYSRNPLLSKNHDILVFGNARRKKLDDGFWWDLYFDPIYEELDLDYIHLEGQYKNGHLTPAKTTNLRYRDFIRSIARLWRKIGVHLPRIKRSELEKLTYIEKTIESEFGVEIDLKARFRYDLELQQPLRLLYRLLLKRIKPKVVLLITSYGRETLIRACKKMDIPVVEFQHGVIHPQHPGYAYPGTRTKERFPDYLLVWGDHWKEAVEYPIPDDRVISVGYPYLEQSVEQYEDVSPRDQILFISQGTIGEQLSKFALKIHEYPDLNYETVYKLHPGEYEYWKEEYPWLVDADLNVIDNHEPPLYQLFAKSTVQVGVYSTALYEGLRFGLDTYLYDCSNVEILQPLVHDGAADIVSSPAGLVSSLGQSANRFDHRRFFSPNPIENISEILNDFV